MKLRVHLCRQILEWIGVRLNTLLTSQVSRSDPWKDPLGVIEVHRQVRGELHRTQLALLGKMASEDPEGWEMYRQIVDETLGDPDIHVLSNCTGLGKVQVNAYQTLSEVIVRQHRGAGSNEAIIRQPMTRLELGRTGANHRAAPAVRLLPCAVKILPPSCDLLHMWPQGNASSGSAT